MVMKSVLKNQAFLTRDHTEELFFVNNDYGGPYWDKKNKTAKRSYANSPHKAVDKWDTPILITTSGSP